MMEDDFDSNPNKWWTDGKNIWIAESKIHVYNPSSPAATWRTMQNKTYTFSGDLYFEKGLNNFGYGFMLNLQDGSNYYYVLIAAVGYYTFGYMKNGTHPIINWSQSPLINMDGKNSISVAVDNGTFTCWINGEFLFKKTDKTFLSGGFGLYSSMNVGAGFDNIKLFMQKDAPSVSGQNSPAEKQIFEKLKSIGYTKSYVKIENNSAVIRIVDDVPDYSSFDNLIAAAAWACATEPSLKQCEVQCFHGQIPIFGFSAQATLFRQFSMNQVTRQEFCSGLAMDDYRNIEQQIRDEIMAYHFYLINLEYDTENAHLYVKYEKVEDKFQTHMLIVSGAVMEYMPWVTTLHIIIDRDGEHAAEITIDQIMIAQYLRGEIKDKDIGKAFSVKDITF